jgi:RND family efflux transporter MFP subunit
MTRGSAAAALLVAVLLGACNDKQQAEVPKPPRPVSAVQVGSVEALGQRQFIGRARAETDAVLSFRVPGRVLDIPVKVGQVVENGEAVAKLDDAPYRADVTRLESDLNAAMADFRAKDEQYKRVLPLVQSGTYSKARLDASQGERDSAEARVESVRAALTKASLDLGDTTLAAPFAGRVVAVYPKSFEDVRAQQQIVRLLDLRRIEVVVDIPETLIALAPLVDTVSVRFDAFHDVELTGTISEIGAEASRTTRTYPVTVVMDQPDNVAILPGMAGTVRVKSVKAGVDGALSRVVPPAALRPVKPGGDALGLWVVDPTTKTVSLRPVSVGRTVRGGVEIADGISAGEWVVMAGANSLVEGEQVRLPETERAP